jgi:tRNA(Ile)-lysidine synthase
VRGTQPHRAIERAVEQGGIIRKRDHILIACSGGSDSVGLSAILNAVAKPMQLRLSLAHINHGVRDSAWQDEAVVLRVSAAFHLPVRIVQLAPQKRDENSLRDARYDALITLASEEGCNVVATGHNAEDQTETVLLALFRGTGAAGIAGMPGRRPLADGVELARPLLRLERTAIRNYAEHAGLPYAVDPTNADLMLRRNAVREALAALRPLFPGLDGAVARTAEVVGAELTQTRQSSLRREIRERLGEEQALLGVDFGHVEAAVRALEKGGSGRFSMGGDVELRIERGRLTVHRK